MNKEADNSKRWYRAPAKLPNQLQSAEIFIFLVQLTTDSIGKLTRLIHTLDM